MGKKYCIYKHTFPNGRVYIGATHQNPLDRWQGGYGYKSASEMYEDILKYGWKNIRHEILDEGLNQEEALKVEKDLIREEELKKRGNTYNIQQTSAKVVYTSFWDMPIDVETINKYRRDFIAGIDAWFDNNKYFPGGMYWNDRMTLKALIFATNPRIINHDLYCDEMHFLYPKKDINFKELKEWLFTWPDPIVNENIKFS